MSFVQAFPATVLIAVATTLAFAEDKKIDPATLKDKVTIDLGKKLFVQFTNKDDVLTKPKTVKKSAESPPTVQFDFRDQDGSPILITKNPFKKDMTFRALARRKGRKDYNETSIVPVKAGIFSLELWQEPLEELVLFDFKLVEEEP